MDEQWVMRRRAVLLTGAAAALALGGCSATSNTTATLDFSRVVHRVWVTSRTMMNTYDAAIKAKWSDEDSLKVLRDNHAKHAAALKKILGDAGGKAGPTADGDANSADALRRAELDGRDQAWDACVSGGDELAVLFGEIAACRATHADVLKVM
jgi:hypothetical protein